MKIRMVDYVCSAGCGHAARYAAPPQCCHRCDGEMITAQQLTMRQAVVAEVKKGVEPAEMRWAREAIVELVDAALEGLDCSLANVTPAREKAIRTILADLTLQAQGLRG